MREVRNKIDSYGFYEMIGTKKVIDMNKPDDWWFSQLKGKRIRLRPATMNDLVNSEMRRADSKNYLADKRGYIVPKECVKII